MKFKHRYVFIPLVVILVALLGGVFTSNGMEWLNTELFKPKYMPPSWAFGVAWNTIFLCVTISAIIAWGKMMGKAKPAKGAYAVVYLLVLNALLNVGWCYMFFEKHLIFPALLEMIALQITNILLMIFLWKFSKISSLLFLPYVLWLFAAFYLNYMYFQLN